MKPKPIVTNTYIVAAFDGAAPRYLCRDSRHGHWVVTGDERKAATFAAQAEAVEAAADYLRLGFGLSHTRPGNWRAYAVTKRLTFAEVLSEAA
jgi:hypothetical protein